MTVADHRVLPGATALEGAGGTEAEQGVAQPSFDYAHEGLGYDGSQDTLQATRVVTIALGHWIHDSYTSFLAPLLPLLKETFLLSNTEAGLLSVFMQEASLVQPLIGRVADRFSARYFVILAPAVTGVVMSLLGSAPSYWTLAILLTIAGLSSACLHAVGPVMVGNASGRRLGTGMSIWMVGGEAGRFIGPLVIAIAVPLLGMRHLPLLMVGGVMASAALLLTLRQRADGGHEMARRGTSLAAEVRGRERLLAVLLGIIVVQVFMSAALTTYLPLLLHDQGESFWLASVSLSVLQAAGVVGAMVGGTLSDRLGRGRLLLAAVLPTSVFMLIFLGTSGWVRFPVLVILGFASLSVTPVVMALVQESFPRNRALANGFYMALSFVIRSLVIILLGRLGDLFGLRMAFLVSAIVPIFGLPLLRWLPASARSTPQGR